MNESSNSGLRIWLILSQIFMALVYIGTIVLGVIFALYLFMSFGNSLDVAESPTAVFIVIMYVVSPTGLIWSIYWSVVSWRRFRQAERGLILRALALSLIPVGVLLAAAAITVIAEMLRA